MVQVAPINSWCGLFVMLMRCKVQEIEWMEHKKLFPLPVTYYALPGSFPIFRLTSSTSCYPVSGVAFSTKRRSNTY